MPRRDALEQAYHELSVVHELTASLTGGEPSAILPRFLEHLARAISARGALVVGWRRADGPAILEAGWGVGEEPLGSPVGEDTAKRLRALGPGTSELQPELLHGLAASWRGALHTGLGARIETGGRTLGVLVVAASRTRSWLRWERSLLRDLAERVGLVLDHARLREDLVNNRVMAAIEQVEDAVDIADAMGRIEYVNPAFERITGWSRHEILGRTPAELLRDDESDPVVYEHAWQELRAGRGWSGRLVGRRRDGEPYPQDVTVSPVLAADGTVTGMVAVRRDVSAQLEAERRLEEAEARLVASQRMEALGRLAGRVAHEFNNVLAVVVSLADLIRSELPEGHRLAGDAADILRTGERATDLVRQLTTFARGTSTSLDRLDLDALVQRFARMLARMLPSRVELELESCQRALPVLGAASELEQVLLNLCLNAGDAMPEGGRLLLSTRRLERQASLVVADTGTGMPPEVIDRIFEPFFTTKDDAGTGLGLSVCFGIVKRHGGELKVESEPGRGARFELLLDLAGEPERA